MGMEVDTKQSIGDKMHVNPDTKKLVGDITDQIMNTTSKVEHEQDIDTQPNVLDISVEICKRLC